MINAFVIFHNNSCLLELQRVWYQATEYAILLRNYTYAFSPGVESGDHSYCCDVGKVVVKTISASNPSRFSIDANCSREIHNLKLAHFVSHWDTHSCVHGGIKGAEPKIGKQQGKDQEKLGQKRKYQEERAKNWEGFFFFILPHLTERAGYATVRPCIE